MACPKCAKRDQKKAKCEKAWDDKIRNEAEIEVLTVRKKIHSKQEELDDHDEHGEEYAKVGDRVVEVVAEESLVFHNAKLERASPLVCTTAGPRLYAEDTHSLGAVLRPKRIDACKGGMRFNVFYAAGVRLRVV